MNATSAAKAISGDVIRMDDGKLQLEGIKAGSLTARDHLQSLIAGKSLIMENESTDRYGRVEANVCVPNGTDKI